MVKISVITINYNNLDGLKKTFESVVNQNFKDFEYIVIDGNSTDGAKKYLENNSSYLNYWVSEPDKGIYNAMNKGIDKATGDYLLFLNSGDYFINENVLEKSIHHKDFVGDIIYGDLMLKSGIWPAPDKLSPFFFVKDALPHQSTFFKKDVFEKMGLYDENYKIVSDVGFFIKCFMSENIKFQHIPIAISFFDQSGISGNANFNSLKLAERNLFFKANFGLFYDDILLMEKQYYQIFDLKNQTLKGIWRRIGNKIRLKFRI
jgi:glycosyltransferase involved in cell wall biosynthesis